MTKAATFLSIIFHPLIMPLYGVALIFFTIPSLAYISSVYKINILIWIGVGTVGLPIAMLPFYKWFKFIDTIEMNTRKERVIPQITTLLLFIFTYYILIQIRLPYQLRYFLLASIFSLACILIVNLFWKISMHMAGIGGVIGLLTVLTLTNQNISIIWISVSIIIAGALASARLKLNEHNAHQLLIGFSTGFIIVFFTISIRLLLS